DTTPDSIKAANTLSDYKVTPNQELIIPKSAGIASNTKNNKVFDTKNTVTINDNKATESKSKKTTHWVKSGDTPFTIAQKYNISLQRLFDLNRLSKGSKIFPGQKLLVE
ncbi:MAG: LysM peptidoglycan-binding domain-containing protein, partial [Desulfamplus sp.]|nr:LysM peptidoglycan-binding domain-containing protein [Desulfamplus sp.]